VANRTTITPREAAALDRLLDAYVGNEEADAGMDDLRTLQRKVQQLDQDHTAYGVFTVREGSASPHTHKSPGACWADPDCPIYSTHPGRSQTRD